MAVAQKNKLLRAVVKMYVELAPYVESSCNEEMATFLLSGFQPASTTKNAATAARTADDHYLWFRAP